MKFSERKREFISSWGVLGQQWGINKAMSQIHALLLVSVEPVSMEGIMDELQMSRGNVSMNLRSLIDWGLVEKTFVSGQRKEFFKAEKDVMEMTKRIAAERKKREVEPVLKLLQKASSIEPTSDEEKEFVSITSNLASLTQQLDSLLTLFSLSSLDSLESIQDEAFVKP